MFMGSSLLTPAFLNGLLWFTVVSIAGLILAQALREPYQLDVTHPLLRPARRESELDGQHHLDGQLRIALLTDLHAEWLRISPARLKTALMDETCDVLLFGGDLTGRHFKPSRALAWLDVIADVAQTKGVPCYAVVGNHDSTESLDLLRKAGFCILKNEGVLIADSCGINWLLIGLDILKVGRPDFLRALRETEHAASAVPLERRIVLAHNPDTLFTLPPAAAGFFLAGHFHGGQIYMPFHLEFLLLRREKVGRMGYHKGSFVLNELSCYISRGLGSVLFPLRLKSRPELAIINLIASVEDTTPKTTSLED